MQSPAVRVAHIITRMILGGAQENTLHVCDALHRRAAWDVLLITGPPIGPEGELLSEVRRRGIPHVVVPEMRRAVNPYYDAVAFVRLLHILRQFKPAVVQTHSSKAGILGRFAARTAGVPAIIHTVEGLPFHRYAPALSNAAFILAERAAARLTDRIVCVAQAMVTQAVSAGIRPRQGYSVIYSGMDVEAYADADVHRAQVRERLGFAADDVVIGKIARLFPLKGHEYVIRAAPSIVARCPRARFLFVGDGVLKEELAARASELGVGDRFVFAGLVPPERIPAMMGAMDVVVHASLREGLARVLVQALLCGKPVVTYDLDGAPEVIVDGVTGRLVPAESVEELAEAVIDAIEHPDQARRMAGEGRRRFSDQFRIETMANSTEQLYCELLAARNK
ncbi:MAG: glycosyltransferase family 4 protein [Candidatus Brocadiae bacterium]|nr:glycosyltransferase family 4 protein [Candidatus Brocadiia bacterium]